MLGHVLEHVPDPIEFLIELESINGRPCKFVIEVPSTDWDIQVGAYWDFGYEHANYFTVSSLRKFFRDCRLLEVFGLQYLLAFGDSSSLVRRVGKESEPSAVFEEMVSIGVASNPINLFAQSGGRYWIWGAAGKCATVMFHFMQTNLPNISLPLGVVDINPAKQGHFMASTGLPIISPEVFFKEVQNNDVIFIINPIYKAEIIDFVGKNCDARLSFRTI